MSQISLEIYFLDFEKNNSSFIFLDEEETIIKPYYKIPIDKAIFNGREDYIILSFKVKINNEKIYEAIFSLY